MEDVKDQAGIGFALVEQGVIWVLLPGRLDELGGEKGNKREQLEDDGAANPHV